MPRSSRLSIFVLVSLLAALFAVPALTVGCAQGNPTSSDPIAEPVATQQPTQPSKRNAQRAGDLLLQRLVLTLQHANVVLLRDAFRFYCNRIHSIT